MRILMTVTAVILVLVAAPVAAQDPLIHAGETLSFRVHSARFGAIGTAVMRVDADSAGGRSAFRLSFDFSARVMLFKVSDQTRSWIDTETMTTLRYSKRERSPVTNRDEWAEILPTGMWASAGREHNLASAEPLDELAFIYLIRALADSVPRDFAITRHFDEARNPVHVRMLGCETIQTAAGPVRALVVQMDVKDTRQKNGIGRLRFYLSADDARVPLRIDASMPVAGALTMTLVSAAKGSRTAQR